MIKFTTFSFVFTIAVNDNIPTKSLAIEASYKQMGLMNDYEQIVVDKPFKGGFNTTFVVFCSTGSPSEAGATMGMTEGDCGGMTICPPSDFCIY